MKHLTTLLLLFSTIALYAQPANDDCGGIINLGQAPVCPSPAIYTNVNATESNIGMDNFPPCFTGTPERDVWFSFVATAAFLDYAISVTGAGASPVMMPQMALYRGDCLVDELVLLDCASAGVGESTVGLNVQGLTSGITYFLRINDWSVSASPNWGTFQICIEENVNLVYTIDQGSSSACYGQLYDTGGPGGNYGNNENHAFTICPTDPHDCIVFNMSNYQIQNGGEQLMFFDGINTSAPLLGNITGGANGASQGGVCYLVVATSGCLTVQFISNGTVNFPGFQGEWTCTNDCPVQSPMNIQVTPSAAAIKAAVENPFMDVTVTNVNCNNLAYGVFMQGDNTSLGMDKGLLLTTGRADQASNPASFFANNNLNLGGDPDLNELNDLYGNTFNTDDACTVEMDVFVKTDRLAFDYVFGSEEYKQQFSQFSNDVMGILVSGPGIPGIPALNNQENIAFVPNGNNTLIQIQGVNATTNWQYYRNNLNSQTIAYNGLTSGFMGESKTLTALRLVTPCQTYHVKLSIGDIDENDDSGLFVAASNAGLPQLYVNFQTGIDYLVEGCTSIPGLLQVTLPAALTTATTFNVELGGTAMLNVDYTLLLGSTITFPAGETQLSFPITVLPDALPEGTETIQVVLKRNYGCGEITVATATIELKDALEVNIFPGQDTVFVCQNTGTVQLQASGASLYTWSPPGIFNNPNSASPTATINASVPVTVTGTLGSCTATNQIYLKLISPQINIQAAGSTQLCQGFAVQLTAVNNLNNTGLVWSPTTGLSNPASNVTMAAPPFTTTYTATVTASAGCSASSQITVTVEPFNFPQSVAIDTVICQNTSVQLASPVNNSTTKFSWSPIQGLNNPNIAGAIATPDQTTTYTLTATSVNGLCIKTATVKVTVLPADVAILPDTLEICRGNEIQINAATSTAGTGLTWSPTDSLTVLTPESVIVNPTESAWYVATLVVGSCTVKDSVYVRVDSLPMTLSIEAIPFKESYCQGEIISLVSPNYPFQQYPDVTHQWAPLTGTITSDTLFNLVINALATTTYVRTTTNHACSETTSITINVVPVAEITITPAMPVICGGQTVQLTASSPQINEFEWSPAAGLSCTDCPNPNASPPMTLTYQVKGEFMGCPTAATVTVTVEPPPFYQFPNPAVICPGISIVLNEVVDPVAGYTWKMPDGTVFSNAAQPSVSPTATTTYTLVIDNGLCPPLTKEVTVTVVQDYQLVLNNDDQKICLGEEVVLSANAGNVIGTYSWSPIGQNGLPVILNSNTTLVVTFTDEYGCFTKKDSFTVSVSPPFILDSLTADPVMLFEGDELMLETFTTPVSLSNPAFNWQVDGNNAGATTTPLFETTAPLVDAPTTFVYKVIITDDFGCMAMDTIHITVKNSAIDMPNVFTPNGDGLNDYFLPVKSSNIQILDFKVWDRWGKRVYNNEAGDTGWDGKYKDTDMPGDVFIFYLRYRLAGVEMVKKGDVTLLR